MTWNLKLEQIKEIGDDIINNNLDKEEDEGCVIAATFGKSLLYKIYKKSRHYLDTIIKFQTICFKYDPLFVNILIIKKCIEEVLNQFYQKNNCDNYEIENDDFLIKIKYYLKNLLKIFIK